jgi:RecA/RadA recombinase
VAKFLTKIKNEINKMNDNAFILSDPDNIYTIKSYTDTGCYALNAILSDGDINKGLPEGARVMFAGESSSAKSLLITYIIYCYLKKYENSICFLFESEKASIMQMSESLGISKDIMDRIIIIPVTTVEETNTQFIKILDNIIQENKAIEIKNEDIIKKNKMKKNKDNQKPLEIPIRAIGVLDSLGMLSTDFELASVADGTNKADAGRTGKLIKKLGRTITMKIGQIGMPFLIANHVYANIGGYGPLNVVSASGIHYMQDIMLVLGKSKDKNESKEQIGNIITVRDHKSRFMKENQKVKINLNFKTGLNKWSNIVEFGQTYGILEKSGNNYLIDDVEVKMKEVKKNPEKYINEALLQKIGKAIKEDFSFGIVDDEGV